MIAAARHLRHTYGRRVASLHGSDVLIFRNSLRARIVGAGRALRHFDSLVCNSAYTASLLRSRFPDVGNVQVAPLGLDSRWFDEPTDNSLASYRARIGWSEGDRIVLTVAQLNEGKGHLATLAAMAKLPESERKRLKYVCVGASDDPAYEARIIETAASLGIQTVLAGDLPDAELAAAYRTASVLALCGHSMPQRVEGFGHVLLEAAAQGLPAVITNVHALPEVVVNGFTGWVCEGDEPSRLATALSMGLACSTSSEMREACVKHARRFTWDRCAEITYSGRRAAAA
jgi:glycosyltransferase involved in cell wall biosynthesis